MTRAPPYHTIYAIAAGDLVMPGTRASATMGLIYLIFLPQQKKIKACKTLLDYLQSQYNISEYLFSNQHNSIKNCVLEIITWQV